MRDVHLLKQKVYYYCLASLKDQCPPPATSISRSNVRPSSESSAMYVIVSAASAGLAISLH